VMNILEYLPGLTRYAQMRSFVWTANVTASSSSARHGSVVSGLFFY
jgi:hypothetical protein